MSKATLKVLHLRASNFYGGPERQLHFHAKYSLHTDIEVTVSSFLEHSQVPEFITKISQDGINTTTFDVTSAYDKKAVSLLKDYIQSNNIEILCTHDYRTHFYGWFASKNLPTKWIAFSRGMTKENFKIKVFTFFEKFVIAKADHLIAVSHSQKQKLMTQNINPDKITTIHNAIDINLVDTITPLSLKKKFFFPEDSFVIISGGRFSTEKGQLYFVKSAETALTKNDKLRFVLFGDGPDLEKVKEYINSNRLGEFIRCPGFETELLRYLKDADMLVNPSLSEGLPNIVLEAMASEVPVVATRVGGLPEIIVHDKNGYLVESQNISELTEAIIALASNIHTRDRFKINARQTIIDSFNFKSQNKHLHEIYKRITSSNGKTY